MNTFTHLFNSLLRRTRLSPNIDPARDWLFLIISSTIILSGIVVWNAWAFDTVANGGTIGSVATSTAPAFDQASLGTIHAIFAERALEEEKYMTGVYQYADPSQ